MENTIILEESHDPRCVGRRNGQPDNKKTPLNLRFPERIPTVGVRAIVLDETTENKKMV